MLKYLAVLVVIFGLTVYVSVQDERAAQQAAQKAAESHQAAIPAKPNEDHPQQSVENAERDLPGWYSFFRWPNGTTTWAIILTLFAIAEQTRHTAKAAEATKESVGAIQIQSGHLKAQADHMATQVEVMQKQLPVMEKANRAALYQIKMTRMHQQAILSAAPIEIEAIPTFDIFGNAFEVQIENYGLSHAFDVKVIGAGLITKSDEFPDIEMAAAWNAPDVTKAGSIVRGVTLSDLTEESLSEDIAAGNVRRASLHIKGQFTYRDVFGQKHHGTFRYVKNAVHIGAPDASGTMKILSSNWGKSPNSEDNESD
jgi:hypothetical protein